MTTKIITDSGANSLEPIIGGVAQYQRSAFNHGQWSNLAGR